MTAGAVATADDGQDDERQEHDEGREPEHLHPARGGTPCIWVAIAQGCCQFTRQSVWSVNTTYASPVPRLWNDTIAAHRREVREATLNTTAALVSTGGLRSVTMARIADETGIARATLYKYFPSVEAILLAWHERQITSHLDQLTEIQDRAGTAVARLAAVLDAYAHIVHESRARHDVELAAFLHRDEQVVRAQHRLHDLIARLITDAVDSGHVRDDVAADELATYCLHALTAATSLTTAAAVRRLVSVTLAGLTARA